jgi:hypothetical protein
MLRRRRPMEGMKKAGTVPTIMSLAMRIDRLRHTRYEA